MKKRFYLTMTLLLTLAVGTSYADDDPSVVTLFEASFENGLGNFVSLVSADRSSDYTENYAWHYNITRQCAECSGESGYLVSPLITACLEKKYCDITLWVEHEGQGANQGNTEMKILKTDNYYWERYQGGGCYYPMSNSSDQFSWGRAPMDSYAQGYSFKFAIYHNPSDEGFYHIKSLKITARDWTLVEGLTEVNSINDLINLPEGSLFKLNFNNAQIVRSEGDLYYLNDGTAGVQVYTYGYHVPSGSDGARISGYVYGKLVMFDEVIPRITQTTMSVSHIDNTDAYSYQPKEITQEQLQANLLNYVKFPATSEITIWDKNSRLGSSYQGNTLNYTPKYETYITGLPVPTTDGGIKILVTDEKSITINLPEIMETPLSEDEIGLWGVVNRQFSANQWYTLCLPFYQFFNSNEASIAKFYSSSDGNIDFRTNSWYDYGEPFLVKFFEGRDKLEGQINAVETNNPASNGDFSFKGTLQTTSPNSGCYYLTAGNTIKPLATGGRINAFRGYFESNTPAAARTRSIVIDGTTIATGDGTTDIEDILNGRTNDEGEVYNLNGQRVTGNSYSKGIYIINGKKVIK